MFRADVSRSEARALHGDVGSDVLSRSPRLRVDVVRIPTGRSVDAAIRRYERDPRVISAEPDRIAVPFDVPNDPGFPSQWSLQNPGQSHLLSDRVDPVSPTSAAGTSGADVDAVTAWDSTMGTATGPVVAVLDNGVDIGHPDLADSLWINPGETAIDGIDDDGNGFIDDANGWDFDSDDPDPSPPSSALGDSHGTHVAGIVAAGRNEGIGVAGICPGCRIMALRFDLTLSNELAAIDYAIANRADVINMSFGSDVWSNAEREAIRAAGAAGILVVAAAGNSSADNDIPFYPSLADFAPSFPASYTLGNVLSVAATNHHDHYAWSSECNAASIARWRCAFTSWGHDSVDVAAPGADIRSSVAVGVGPGGSNYAVFDGTSMSAPLVAGIAGLVLDQQPTYTPLDLKNAIMNSVDHPTSLRLWSSWQDLTGFGRTSRVGAFTRTQGRVNANAALTAPITNASPTTDGNVIGARSMRRASIRGRVTWPADVNDVYRKRLRRRVRYVVALDGPRRVDIDLWVFNPGTKEIWQFTSGCFLAGGRCPALRAVSASRGADERVVFTARRSGVHFIVVTGWYSGGRYDLTVRRG
jgi:subtilisin family serine protease